MDPQLLKPGHLCDVCGGPMVARSYMRVVIKNSDATPPGVPITTEHSAVVYVCPDCDQLGAR